MEVYWYAFGTHASTQKAKRDVGPHLGHLIIRPQSRVVRISTLHIYTH